VVSALRGAETPHRILKIMDNAGHFHPCPLSSDPPIGGHS